MQSSHACLVSPRYLQNARLFLSARSTSSLFLMLALDVWATALGRGLALVDDHALEVLALGLLGGDFPDDG